MARRSPKNPTRRARNGHHAELCAASTHESVEGLTDRFCEVLRGLPLDEKARFRLKFAVHEALANAVEHGNHNDPSKQVTLTLDSGPERLVVIIDDEGNGFDPGSIPDPTQGENLLHEGGRGIFLLRRFADECRFENNGRRVVLIKHLA